MTIILTGEQKNRRFIYVSHSLGEDEALESFGASHRENTESLLSLQTKIRININISIVKKESEIVNFTEP